MKPTENPCFRCVPPKRKVGCHSGCRAHKEYSDAYHEKKETIEKERHKELVYGLYNKHKVARLKERKFEK